MKTAKLILLASPILIASTLLPANQAEASTKNAPSQSHLAFASARSDSESVTPNFSQESNPIIDKMGCQCSSCVKPRQEIQGKLPFANI